MPSNSKTVRSLVSRFKMWAGSLGAHRPHGHRSLEYRLSGSPVVRDHVVSLLEDICEHVKGGKYKYSCLRVLSRVPFFVVLK